MERLEIEIKEIEELKTKTTEYKISKSLYDLNFERGREIDEMMEIEVKPEELKVPITRINVVKELMIPEKYLYHTLQLKKYY